MAKKETIDSMAAMLETGSMVAMAMTFSMVTSLVEKGPQTATTI
ncbi:MAG: hypothetical protein AAGB19_12040 [Cyanobacteria bacterium P01_F01_bin.3]